MSAGFWPRESEPEWIRPGGTHTNDFVRHWGMCGPVDEAQSCTDNRRRMTLYHQADRLLVAEETAIIPTVYSRRVALVHLRVKGWWSGIGYRSLSELIIEETE